MDTLGNPFLLGIRSRLGGFKVLSLWMAAFLLLLSLFPAIALAEGSFLDAIRGGKWDLYLRYRFEHADDNFIPRGKLKSLGPADASTLRSALGYRTGIFHGFSAYGQIQNVSQLYYDNYNDGSNGRIGHAVIADPQGTQAHQYYLSFTGIPKTELRGGRQDIAYRDAPLHRFVGNVLFRQYWQTYDAFSLKTTYWPKTTFQYAYVWNVNKIFGEKAPSPLDDWESNSHFFTLNYDGIPVVKTEVYAYLLDFANSKRFSSQTYGVRFSGGEQLWTKIRPLYTVEYAHQSDYNTTPFDYDVNYVLGEIGAEAMLKDLSPITESIAVKYGYELLEGDGGLRSFQTPLGTNHAFQGWADRFLTTPGDGIEDQYVSAVLKAFGFAKFIAMYHWYESDKDSYKMGEELNLEAVATFAKYYTIGVKYADYQGDANRLNVARNGNIASDLSRLWGYIQFSY